MYPGQGHGPGGHGHYPPHGEYGAPAGGYPPPQGTPWGQPPPGQWAPPEQQGYGGYPQQQYHHQPPQQHYPPQQQYEQQQYNQPQYHQQQYQQPPPQNHYPQYNQGPPPQVDPRGAVPQGIQRFGHGAPNEYTYQYSNCTGRRKALLIGINYFRSKNELKGCINDVHNVSSFLVSDYGYEMKDIVMLTDNKSNPVEQPTKANIIRAMEWLVKDAQPNDSLFLHYSGHGGQTKDLDGDEDDGYDEVIYPVDYTQNGHIVDDQIHAICVASLKPGVRMTCIFDSCHSGSVMDLPYVYSTKGALKEPNLAKEAGQNLLAMGMAYARGDTGSIFSSLKKLTTVALNGDKAYEKTKRTKTSPADVILWSGSRDDQTSADATIASQATGAMSYAFINALKSNKAQGNPSPTYLQLLNDIRDILQQGYSQKPQLSCSHPLEVDRVKFIM